MKDRFIKYISYFIILLLIVIGSIHIISHLCKPKIPVLMYHAFCNEPNGGDLELFVTPDNFESHLVYLKKSGYDTIFAEDIFDASEYDRPVIITIDDGYEDNYTEAFPLLKKHNMKATIFVISSYIGKEGYLNAEQLKEMSNSGLISIQSHTASHTYLTDCSENELKDEFEKSKKCIESITGRTVNALAYPGGFYNEKVIKYAKKYYKLAFCVNSNNLKLKDNYEFDRVGIFRSTDLYSLECSLWSKSRTRFYQIINQ